MAYIGPKVTSILETEINWNNVKNVPASISKVFQSDGSTTEFGAFLVNVGNPDNRSPSQKSER